MVDSVTGDGLWQAVGGKRPCDGCGDRLNTADVRIINTMRKLVFCGKPECHAAWVKSINNEKGAA